MRNEDRVIGPHSLHDERTDPIGNLHRHLDALRTEFLRVQQDGTIRMPERLTRLDALQAEIRQTFAEIQAQDHFGPS